MAEQPSSSLAQDRGQARPVDPAILQKAAQWMARLWADDACEADRAACRQWRAAHPDNERAWRRLQAFDSKLQSVPRHAAPVLAEPAAKDKLPRRRVLGALAIAALTAGAAPVVRDSGPWRRMSADYSAGVGEIREVALADGTRLLLNTASAVDVRFDATVREVVLLAGEVLIRTSPDSAAPARPFMVRSRHGVVRALGTRFTVRQDDDISHVAVFEGAVHIQPGQGGNAGLQLDAGQRSVFSSQGVQPPSAVSDSDAAWSRGLLVAENMRVEDFLHELSRYRPGLLRCSPDVADLLVSGVFALADTDRVLANLELALPVQVAYRTRYWVTVNAR